MHRSRRLPKSVRARRDELHANDLIDLEHGVYRARQITLYSSYQLPAPPITATDKRVVAAISAHQKRLCPIHLETRTCGDLAGLTGARSDASRRPPLRGLSLEHSTIIVMYKSAAKLVVCDAVMLRRVPAAAPARVLLSVDVDSAGDPYPRLERFMRVHALLAARR
jgi:hypothetical protein